MNWFTNLFKKKNRKRKVEALKPDDPMVYVNGAEGSAHHFRSNDFYTPPSHHDGSHYGSSHYDNGFHGSDSSGFDSGGHH